MDSRDRFSCFWVRLDLRHPLSEFYHLPTVAVRHHFLYSRAQHCDLSKSFDLVSVAYGSRRRFLFGLWPFTILWCPATFLLVSVPVLVISFRERRSLCRFFVVCFVLSHFSFDVSQELDGTVFFPRAFLPDALGDDFEPLTNDVDCFRLWASCFLILFK